VENDNPKYKDYFPKIRPELAFQAKDAYREGESTSDIIGKNGRIYNYTQPGTVQTYNMRGGIVIYLDNNVTQAFEALENIAEDKIFGKDFGVLSVEFSFINRNFHMVVHNRISFVLHNTGLIESEFVSKAFSLFLYNSVWDYFKLMLEIIFVLSMIAQTINYYYYGAAKFIKKILIKNNLDQLLKDEFKLDEEPPEYTFD